MIQMALQLLNLKTFGFKFLRPTQTTNICIRKSVDTQKKVKKENKCILGEHTHLIAYRLGI